MYAPPPKKTPHTSRSSARSLFHPSFIPFFVELHALTWTKFLCLDVDEELELPPCDDIYADPEEKVFSFYQTQLMEPVPQQAELIVQLLKLRPIMHLWLHDSVYKDRGQ